MARSVRLALVMAAALAATGEARAQFGYGYYPAGYGAYGWGGWGGGGTVQGSIARGLGAYAAGAGVYNEDTAIANTINAEEAMRWNEYMYDAQLVADRNERINMARRLRRDAGASDAAYKRVLENPSPDDIASGDALNAALNQITNPRVHSSALRLATDKIPGKVVREIPFVNASDAITINLDRLTAADGWPVALRDPRLDQERDAYSRAIDKALEEDRNGDISAETLRQVRAALSRLRNKFESARPNDRVRAAEAENYMKTLFAMTRMLERPDVDKVIAELENTKETTLGSLLGFMHTFNLRFGRATTPAQRAAYEHIYPLIDAHRDRIVKETKADAKAAARSDTPPPPPPAPTNFFQGMHLDHLEGKKKD